MVTVEKFSKSETDHANQGIMGHNTEETRLELIKCMSEKKKGAGYCPRPLPQRGDVKKRIVKDVMDSLAGCARNVRSSIATRVHDESVLQNEE